MRVRLIFGQYQQRYDGELMPNVLDAWDEYVLDDNPIGYQEALAKFEAMVPSELEWVRELDIHVPDAAITALAVPSVPWIDVVAKRVD